MKPCGVVPILATAAILALLWPRPQAMAPKPVKVPLANRVVEIGSYPQSPEQTPSVRGTLPYVLATTSHVDQSLRLAAEAAGVRVIGPLSGESFLVESTPAALQRLSSDSRFVGAVEFMPSDKLDERLFRLLGNGAAEVTAAVVTLAPADKAALQEFVSANDGEILEGCLNGDDSFRAKLPAELVNKLTKRGDVRWIEQFSRPHLLNDYAVEPAAMNVREVWETHGLTGTNQVVSTSDSGIDSGDLATMHRDLAGRLCGLRGAYTDCDTMDTNGHGTHTAGSIVGDGTMSDGVVRGVAHGARLWAWCCLNKRGELSMPASCEELFRPDQESWPTYIHSASWGNDAHSCYDQQCYEVDEYVWKNPDFLPVFAAGNSGKARDITSPATAKNVLAVGATQNLRDWYNTYRSGEPAQLATFSSRGPSLDGRTKPDVSAPGVGILSTRSFYATSVKDAYNGIYTNENYAYNCGTSMATPLVAGAMALVREWLVDRCGFTNAAPSAALMKAIATGGAKGVSSPDNNFGWGRVDLGETLFPSNRSVKLVDWMPFTTGRTFTYEVVTTNTAPLEVQLAWIDCPSTAGGSPTSPRLVNNLDLTVETMEDEAQMYYGNGGKSADTLNTLESVRIAAAAPKRYLITVKCSSITCDHTEGGAAALYVRGAFDAENGFVDNQTEVLLTVSADTNGAVVESTSPSVGVHKCMKGDEVTFSAPEWAYDITAYNTESARYPLLGYSLDGADELAGTSSTFTLQLTNDLSVAWRYSHVASDYRFRIYLAPINLVDYWGQISEVVVDQWLTNNTSFSVGLPSDYVWDSLTAYGWYYSLSGDGPYRGNYQFRLGSVIYYPTDSDDGVYLINTNNGCMWPAVDIIMDEGCELWCEYYNDLESTTDGLPYWWYMRYLWGGEKLWQYDSSANGDPDGDGFTNMAEYGDETNPVDDSSFRFKFDNFSLTNMTFTGSVKGSLIVERTDSPSGEWQGVLTNSTPRTSTTNFIDLGAMATSNGFYRVRYEPPVQ